MNDAAQPDGLQVEVAPSRAHTASYINESEALTIEKAADFLARLETLDVRLTVSGGRLACDAPKGVLNEELKAELTRYKRHLIQLVMARGGAFEIPNKWESEKNKIPAIGSNSGTLSFGQKRLWYLEQLGALGAANNISIAIRLEGQVVPGALEQALREVVRRHHVLRTALLTVNAAPATRLTGADDWQLTYFDLRSHQAPGETVNGILESEIQRPFELQSGKLLRAVLVQTGEADSTLLICAHHIAMDGWSCGILLREMTELYDAFRAGLPHQLPPLPLQYSDYSNWQTEWMQSGAPESELKYWAERLRGVTPLQLPADRPRPAVPSYRGKRIRHVLSPDVAAGLREVARNERVTLNMVLLTGFYLLLHRYTRLTDLTVGGAVAGRHKPEFENLIGVFINSLAFRTSLDCDPTVRELLCRVRETTLDALAHQHVPFDQVVAAVQPHRDSNRAPLFEVMFILQNLPIQSIEIAGLRAHQAFPDQATSRFDLTVEAVEYEGAIRLEFEYRTDLFEESTMRTLATHFERLLEQLPANPLRRISELRMLSDGEVSAMLAAGQGRATKQRWAGTVSEWIEAQCLARPAATAVVCAGREVSYSELSHRSNQLAHYLRELGVGRGSLVGVCLDRSEEVIIAVLAVWKAGAAYVPLDPMYPAERLAFMAEDAAISVLITQHSLRQVAPFGPNTKILAIDTECETIARQDPGLPRASASADDLAYVIFTSGSTGKPKGVQVGHGALANLLSSMLDEPGLKASDRLLSVTTLSFDIAGLEIYLPLVAGACIVMATREVVADGRQLAILLAGSGATVMQATPATWRMLLEAGWEQAAGLKIICGGEALPQDLANRLLAIGGELWNAYGPTETTIWSTLQRVSAPEHVRSIGRPIANTSILILDEARQLVPRGATGELYIGGDGLARGYLNRPALTAERFVEHPFAAGERLYRTGDLARWLPDGTLEFLGRIDQQVKIRGLRVELEEIEAALEAFPEVRQAVVALHDFGSGDQRLIAYLLPRGSAEIDGAAIRKSVARTLPEYMVPAHVVTVRSIPLTPNGKVDRRSLEVPQFAAAARVLPRSDVERRVATVWQEVLQTPEVGIHDNFFDIGGHSLLLVQLQNRLSRSLAGELSIQDLFRNPTVAAIAEHWSALHGGTCN